MTSTTPHPRARLDLSMLLNVALEAVSAAAVLTRGLQMRLKGEEQASKGLDDPVTIGDFASQAVVNNLLRSRLGDVTIVGEESAARLRAPEGAALLQSTVTLAREVWSGASAADVLDAIDLGAPPGKPGEASDTTTRESYWTLDPIDGTKGFIRGHQYCVALAYIERGVPVVAALACPNLSADFARPLTDPDAHGVTLLARADGPLEVVATDAPAGARRAVERVTRARGEPLRFTESFVPSHSSHGLTARLTAALTARGHAFAPPCRIDSQCKYALVARGQSDIYLRSPRKTYIDKIWDHAPGVLIASRAGCTATDALGHPLDFTAGAYLTRNHGSVVAEPVLHAEAMAELAKLG